MATILDNLRAVAYDLGQPERAISLYEQAAQIHKTSFGEGHPDYAIALNNLATAHAKMIRLGEAEALYPSGFRHPVRGLGAKDTRSWRPYGPITPVSTG